MKICVSIVIPVYNRRKLICAAVDSVLRQDFDNVEVIIVDDGSTDGTGELLKERYSNQRQVRYIHQENAERASARNRGICAASGEFVAFLDSDDLWLPHKLGVQMRKFDETPRLVMVHSGCAQLYENGETVPIVLAEEIYRQPNIFSTMVQGDFIASPTPVVRRWMFDRIGGFNEDPLLNCYEDWEMFTRIAAVGPVGYVPEVLALRRLHGGNTEKPVTPEVYSQFVKAVSRDLKGSLKNTVMWSARKGFWARIRDATECGDMLTARAYFLRGVSCVGPRMLVDINRNRFALASLMFGQRVAKVLFSVWQKRTGRH